MKLAICGPGRSGKDTAAEWLRDHTTLTFGKATSEFIAPLVAAKLGILGISAAEAFARRHESSAMRALFFETAVEARRDDPAYFARRALETGDVCVGVRDRPEMELTRGLVDLALWVERPGIAPDPTLRYGPELCDVVVMNDGTLDDFYSKLRRLAGTWGVLHA